MSMTDRCVATESGDGPRPVPELLRELSRRGAGDLPHMRGSVLEHLQGVHQLLVDWQNPDWVCAAGLFHSFYGTDRLDVALGADTERAVLLRLLGSQGEALAWLYCTCDFPLFQASLLSGGTPRYCDRRNGQLAATVPAALLPPLCELLVANEVELATGSATYRDKKRALLQGVVQHREAWLTTGAVAAVRGLLSIPAAETAG